MRFRGRIVLSVVLAVGAARAAEPADPPAIDVTAAAAQFDRGLAAMNANNLDEACPAFAESVRLDPRPGAIFTLAECEFRWGRVASAAAHYDDYLARYGRLSADQQRQQQEREAIARQKRAELQSKIPTLTIRLPKDAPNDTVVKRDGIALGAPSLGVALSIDPGAHEILVEANGGVSKRTVTLALGGHEEVEVAVPPAPSSPAQTSVDVPSRESPTRRYLAYGTLALGAIGVGVGATFGLLAIPKADEVKQHCSGTVCDHEGKVAADDAQRDALISTIGFGVGGAAILAGVALLLFPGKHTTKTASLPRISPIFAPNTVMLGAGGALP